MSTEMNNKPGPLTGVRIIEYGVFHAGPGAGAILAEMGADVIKIEAGEGDLMRFWTKTGAIDFGLPRGGSLMFEISNRNKRAIRLDIKKEKGVEILHRLVKKADVFITNLRKTTKTKLGIDYEALSKVNPKIIHANISGYGPEGPLSDIGAFDPLGQARSGMMFLVGNEEPTLIHLAVLDQSTAIAASQAITSALFARERQGIGQEIHVSLFSTAIWLMYVNFMMKSHLGKESNIKWDQSQNTPLRNAFKCKDGKWIVGTNHPEEKYWEAFCEETDQQDLIDDPRFCDTPSRIANCPELIDIFKKVFLTGTRDQWMEKFVKRGLMFSPVQTIDEVIEDPQAEINNYIVDYESPFVGNVKVPGYPIHFSANHASAMKPAPGLGEHTNIVMQELGLSDIEIKNLKNDGIIQ